MRLVVRIGLREWGERGWLYAHTVENAEGGELTAAAGVKGKSEVKKPSSRSSGGAGSDTSLHSEARAPIRDSPFRAQAPASGVKRAQANGGAGRSEEADARKRPAGETGVTSGSERAGTSLRAVWECALPDEIEEAAVVLGVIAQAVEDARSVAGALFGAPGKCQLRVEAPVLPSERDPAKLGRLGVLVEGARGALAGAEADFAHVEYWKSKRYPKRLDTLLEDAAEGWKRGVEKIITRGGPGGRTEEVAEAVNLERLEELSTATLDMLMERSRPHEAVVATRLLADMLEAKFGPGIHAGAYEDVLRAVGGNEAMTKLRERRARKAIPAPAVNDQPDMMYG